MKLAAERGFGVMAAPPFPLSHIGETLDLYREIAPAGDPGLVLIRFYHMASTREAALAEAKDWLAPFVDRMRATTPKIQPDWAPWMDVERMIADSLIGAEADIRRKIKEISARLNPRSLVLKPLSPDFERRKESLRLFAEMIGLPGASGTAA